MDRRANKLKSREKELRRKKAMLMRTRNRIGVAFSIVVVALLVIIGRIIMINYEDGEAYSKKVLANQSHTNKSIPFERGKIIDRNGTVLAYSEKVYNIIMDPALILSKAEYREPSVSAICSYFGFNRSEIEEILATKPNSKYVKLLSNISSEALEDYRAFIATKDDENSMAKNVVGIFLEDSYIRKYPFNSLACDVIGFANATNGGMLGIESQYNNELSGIDGVTYSFIGDNLQVNTSEKKAVDGNNIVTTIDYKIQSIIESKIAELNKDRPSKATSVIAMDPNTCEILAMANYPFFDLNNPRDLTSVYTKEELDTMSEEQMTEALYALWSNYCISAIIEPGSTYKVFTIAEALEEANTYDGEMFVCNGYTEVSGETIKCHVYNTTGSHGMITLMDSLGQSCNPAMIELSSRMGGAKMCTYQAQLGLGGKTGIDLPGEETGLLKSGNMTALDAATNSFGQNFNVTMIQMATAFCSVVNGGEYYQPHVVKRIEKQTGEVVKNIDPLLVRYTVTESTAKLVRQYLRNAVENGLVRRANIAGYEICGKTGTAQKLPRSENRWLVSYLGCAPMDNPQIVLYVVIDEPYQTTGTGGTTNDALNLTKSIYEEVLPYLNVYKDIEEEPVDTSNSPVEGSVESP